jgi:hypothetical protein
MKIVKYIPAIEHLHLIDGLKDIIQPDDMVLFGEYGVFNPLSLVSAIHELNCQKRYLELIARNKNRELIRSSLHTGAAVGFDGVIIASGSFNKQSGMGKPVYDLDPTQILKLALALRREGGIDQSFSIGIRVAIGDGAPAARARFLLKEGADLIAVTEDPVIDDLRERAVLIEEVNI